MEKINKQIIVEDGLSLVDNVGPGQYTKIVIEVLKQLGYDVILPNKHFIMNIKNKNLRRFFYLIWLNTFFLFKQIFIFPKQISILYTNYSMPFIKINRIRQFPVVHDLCSYLYPETMTKIQNFYSIMATNNAIKNGDKIITVSKTVKEEIIKQFNIPANRIAVIYNSNTLNLGNYINMDNNQVLDSFNLIKKGYIIAVSTFNRRKNILELIEAFNLFSKENKDIKLVLVGGNGNDNKINFIRKRNKNIIFTGFLSNEDLGILYKNALFFISPSLYEGFGIPIIDAQQFELPVLCSDINVYHEVAKESAIYSQPNKIAFYNSIKNLVLDIHCRNILIEKGKENIKRFSLNIIKKQIKEVLE